MPNALNAVYSRLSMRRRYEVWFVRLGLADGRGAWWFRYLLTNPGREGCGTENRSMPVQVWATYFGLNRPPQTFISGFPVSSLQLSARGQTPFHFSAGENAIDENSCRGKLQVDAHNISWDLRYHSRFSTAISNKGWIGFSHTPHSDASLSGEIRFDDLIFRGEPLGFGVQGHNCGYRHRNFWTWAHAYFPSDGGASTLEALTYEMPLGLTFRKAVLWHDGERRIFRKIVETERKHDDSFRWQFRCVDQRDQTLEVAIQGNIANVHRLSYMKTDCSGSFEVLNNSLCEATVRMADGKTLRTDTGAVLEMVGEKR